MLKINAIAVSSGQHKILNNLSLAIKSGSIHAIMGPNGSGKSTLAYTLMGHPEYTLTKGTLELDGQDITLLSPDKRAKLGLFLAFQNPCIIPGVTALHFLKEAYQALTPKHTHEEFTQRVKDACEIVGFDQKLLARSLNDGFSGGEKKRLEIVQLLVLRPRIVILDEIDSGLDVDALKMVAEGIMQARRANPTMIIMIITHYQRILQYITPDAVHILMHGNVKASGGHDLAQRIEQEGYAIVGNYQQSVGNHAEH